MKKINNSFFCLVFVMIMLFPTVIASNITETNEKKDFSQTSILIKDTIEFNGICRMFLHFRYRTRANVIINPDKNIVKTGLSFILFQNAEININNGEFNQYGSGILILFRFKGGYDLDYNEKTLQLHGQAIDVHVLMK